MIVIPTGFETMRLNIPERSLRMTTSEEVDASASAIRLRPPPGTGVIRVTCGLVNVRWSDFSIPDGTTGHKLLAGETFFYPSDSKTFRVYGGKVQVSYYEVVA